MLHTIHHVSSRVSFFAFFYFRLKLPKALKVGGGLEEVDADASGTSLVAGRCTDKVVM